MPGPIAHIFLAISLYPTHFADKDLKEFIVGTSFPDIRYICPYIKRENTHYSKIKGENITIEMVKNERSSFISGMLFHALVDETRDKYLHKKSAYKIIPRTGHAITGIKFVEDLILYDKIPNKENISNYFNSIVTGETIFNVKENDIRAWHKFIKLYLAERMTPEHRLRCYIALKYPYLPQFLVNWTSYLAIQLNILPSNFIKIIELLDVFEKNNKLMKIINNFYDNFEQICFEQEKLDQEKL